MRMERKKWDTGSERTSLTERKIELLESIDFIWAQNHKGEIGWERRFQEIRKFKRKHGHCNVPTKSAENRALGRWVSTQRTMYKNYMKGFVGKSLTREEQERRIFLLLKEGFLFSMIPNGQSPNGAGGEEQQDAEGSSNEESTNMAVPSAAAASLLATPLEQQITSGIGDSSNPAITTTTATTSPLMKPAPAPAAVSSHLTSEVSTDHNKTPSIGDSDNEPKQNKHLLHSEPNRVASEDTNGEHKSQPSKNETNETPPFSPSHKEEGVSNQDDRMAETSSPPPVPPSTSIAQVSVTTTPTTTPSVSTVASPDRSQSGDEPNAYSENTKMVSIVKNETMDEKKECSVGEIKMPVAPSLESKPATNNQLDVVQKNLPKNLSKNLSLTHDAKAQTLTLKAEISSSNGESTPTRKASPAKEKAKVNGKSPILKKESPNANANANAEPKAITATASPKSPKERYSPTKPVLITSDGLRIVIKMKDYDVDDITAAQLSPNSTFNGIASADGAHSPSRRSVRARKPSARQLEAEKSPLRESILGR